MLTNLIGSVGGGGYAPRSLGAPAFPAETLPTDGPQISTRTANYDDGTTRTIERTFERTEDGFNRSIVVTGRDGETRTAERSFVRTDTGFERTATLALADGRTITRSISVDKEARTVDALHTMMRADGSGRTSALHSAPDTEGPGRIVTRTSDLLDATTLGGLLPSDPPADEPTPEAPVV
jgi:hypothetical protein